MKAGPGLRAPAAPALADLQVIAIGALALALAMGVGRFAFTPLLPLMLRDGTLELAYWPHLDHTDGATPRVYPLVTGVTAFELEYLTRDGSWLRAWPRFGEDEIPRAVRLTLTLADGVRIDRWFTLR